MDGTLRQTMAGALLATGCLCSAPSHAYSAVDDSEAQDREVKAAYDRGYQAAKQELAREAASRGAAASAAPATVAATSTSAPAPTAGSATAQKPAARKPILDIKHVYSDASDVEIVKEVPVTSKPLAEQQSAQAAAPDEARPTPSRPVARQAPVADESMEASTEASTDADELPPPQPVQRAAAPVRRQAVQRVPQPQAQPPEELADDDGYDTAMPRAAQAYSAPQPQYARPRAQYAPPPVAMQPPPQNYAYVQRPTYVATRPYTYYGQPAAWGDAYQPAPYEGRWYWSPQYGRWLYY
ncbi:hypothetical protein [Paraburkholderia sp. C35]|uniref:hypothetical protein n=1 Tax=Paraburkholderia sp. C35 TaxID=2126993 RepID=UPI000D68DC8B|nr:hypothetical protein [Paraburkholderia sp. C35]